MDDYIINEYAVQAFRDSGDQHYIAARSMYRLELDQQFRWMSLQVFEKYLKAILLFNGKSTKGLRHKIALACERVSEIPDLGFTLPTDVNDFINFLSEFGADRYLCFSTYMPANALLNLDKGVWCVRRFCFYINGQSTPGADGKRVDLREGNLAKIHSGYYMKNPHLYKIPFGYLEKVIERRSIGYETLVWKNFYFGRRQKKCIHNFTERTGSVNPPHALNPDTFSVLKEYVDFPKEVRELYSGK